MVILPLWEDIKRICVNVYHNSQNSLKHEIILRLVETKKPLCNKGA